MIIAHQSLSKREGVVVIKFLSCNLQLQQNIVEEMNKTIKTAGRFPLLLGSYTVDLIRVIVLLLCFQGKGRRYKIQKDEKSTPVYKWKKERKR